MTTDGSDSDVRERKRAYMAEYNRREDVKARKNASQRALRETEEGKQATRQYNQTQNAKESRKEYDRKRNAVPERRERLRELWRLWHRRKRAEKKNPAQPDQSERSFSR